jgi:hypothetical protein
MDQQGQTSEGQSPNSNEAILTTDTAAQVAPAPEPTVAEKINQIAATKNPDALTPQPTYTPNYKFKAADKEYEFDEVLRGVVKNEAQEKKLRELYEKGYGIDQVKSERDKHRTSFKELETQHTVLNRGLDTLSTMLEKGDFHGFFNALQIPEQQVLQYALSRVQYRELPPEQRQQLDSQYESQQRLQYLEQANEELQSGYQQQLVQHRANELDSYLGRPDVNQVASVFDARVGTPGAFRDEVIRRGQYYASLPDGQDVPVERAVREVLGLVGPVAPQGEQAESMEATQAPFMQNQKPVIPNIKGRGTSPAKKVVRSIDDLRKLGQSME